MKFTPIFLSLTLSTLILFNSFRVSITFAYYKIDPVGFIEKLCENKDKPEMKCNGKCHLKKVAEGSTENQQESEKYISLKEITLFIVEKININFLYIRKPKNNLPGCHNLYAFNGNYQIDHPPQT